MFKTLKERADGSADKYRWPSDLEKLLADGVAPLPPVAEHKWKVIDDLESVKKVLTTEAGNFTSSVPQRLETTAEIILQQNKRVRGVLS